MINNVRNLPGPLHGRVPHISFSYDEKVHLVCDRGGGGSDADHQRFRVRTVMPGYLMFFQESLLYAFS